MIRKKLALIGAGAVFVSTAAVAGFVQPQPVTIDMPNMWAHGDQVSARYADNKEENIGCGIRTIQSGGAVMQWGFCQASNAKGEYVICQTQNEDLLQAIKAISAFSYIRFNWDRANECTQIGNSTQSLYLPKGLDKNF